MITSTKLTSNFPLCDTMYDFSTYSDIGCACGMPTSRVECWCIFWLVYKDKVVIILPLFYLFSACIYVVVSPALRVTIKISNYYEVSSNYWNVEQV